VNSLPLVIGLGNTTRGDDGLGVFVVKSLLMQFPDAAEYCIEVGDLTRLIHFWEGRRVIIIDAIRSLDSPGKLQVVDESSLSTGGHFRDSHGMDIPQILELSRLVGKPPKELLLLGLVGKDWGMGEGLSRAVSNSIPILKRKIYELLVLESELS
jgi:hydrogenase maturation protease